MNLLSTITFTAVFVMSATFSNPSDAQVVVKLHGEQVLVQTEAISLSDIATITPPNSSDAKKLRTLDVDVFGHDTDELSLSKEQIRIRLALAGFTQVKIQGPDSLSVLRVERQNTRGAIELQLSRQISQLYSIPLDDLQITLDSQFKEPTAATRVGQLKIDAIHDPELPLGRNTFLATTVTQSGERKTLKLPVQVAVFKKLAVAKQDIPAGSMLTKENMDSVRRPISSHSSGYLSLEFAIGKQTQFDVQQYELLKPNQIRRTPGRTKPVIRRNTFVDAVVKRGPLTVTLKDLKTLSDGMLGEPIQVLNVSSNQKLVAKVIDSRTVEIR